MMSTYYKINGMKVRVSDHEPNFSMDKFRGRNDLEFYTVSADNRKLSVIDQIQRYCDKNELDVALFTEVINDYPDEVYVPVMTSKVVVTAEFIEGYLSICGKGSMKKKDRYCQQNGVDAWKVSQGNYIVR